MWNLFIYYFVKKNHALIVSWFTQSQCVHYRELNREAIDHAVPKNSVRYIEGLLWEFDQDAAGS